MNTKEGIITYMDDYCFTCEKPFRVDLDFGHEDHRTLGKFISESNQRMRQYDKVFTLSLWVVSIFVIINIIWLITRVVLVLSGG